MRADRRTLVVIVVLLAALAPVVVAFLADDGGPTGGPPFDPRSTDPDGTRAFVGVLEETGIDVEVRAATVDPGGATVVVFVDLFGGDERRALRDWVRDGGRLIMLDPFSPLGRPMRVPDDPEALEPDATCDIPALAAVTDVDLGRVEVVDRAADDAACPRFEEGALVVEQAFGDGTVVTAGIGRLLVNDAIARRDHAALGIGAVGPTDRVLVLDAAAPGGGERGLVDLLPAGVILAFVQLLLVGAVEMIRRARRLGRLLPDEPGIIGDATAPLDAAAAFRARSEDRDGALADLRGELAHRLGVDHLGDAPDFVVAGLARDAGIDLGVARRSVTVAPVTSDDELLELASAVTAMTDVATRSRLPEEITS